MQINKSQLDIIAAAVNHLFDLGNPKATEQSKLAASEMLNRIKSELGALPNTCLEFSKSGGKSSVIEKGERINLTGKKGQSTLMQWTFAVLRVADAQADLFELAASDPMTQVSNACHEVATKAIEKAKAAQQETAERAKQQGTTAKAA